MDKGFKSNTINTYASRDLEGRGSKSCVCGQGETGCLSLVTENYQCIVYERLYENLVSVLSVLQCLHDGLNQWAPIEIGLGWPRLLHVKLADEAAAMESK